MKISEQIIARYKDAGVYDMLALTQRGIEKESLRANLDGQLSLSPHPQALGSALCNSWLTTDFSESLLEFVTPVFNSPSEVLNHLEVLHQFTARNLPDNECLWPSSMPCALPSDPAIPLAQYGKSNSGLMKTAYRRGLGHRYGRAMQTVAGIHYNFSLPVAFWEHEKSQADSEWQNRSLREYIDFRYLGLIRNFRRNYWLLIYLFGASPFADKSFTQGRSHALNTIDHSGDLYLPHATSLRMGDLGYQSKAQESLFVCYNQLDSYVTTLKSAIRTNYEPYAAFGTDVDGVYQQLSTSILQIENEFYSPIRPKRVTQSGQTPANALTESGIEYIEVRCIDLDPAAPCGLTLNTIAFLDTFLLSCLFAESPLCDEVEFSKIAINQKRTVEQGRKPNLTLVRREGGQSVEVSIRDWATEILEGMSSVAAILDRVYNDRTFSDSVSQAKEKINNPSLTPSGKVMESLLDGGESFLEHTRKKALSMTTAFRSQPLAADLEAALTQGVALSWDQHRSMENSDEVSFKQFLQAYFEQ